MAENNAVQEILQQQRAAALQEAMVMFDAIDTNNDGNIVWNEAVQYAKKNSNVLSGKGDDIQAFFDEFDANKDGKVSRQEWSDFYAKVFDDFVAAGFSPQ